MLLKLAWRNIFRNRRRTAVIILTIGIGLWGLAVSSAFWDGMILQMIENAVGSETGQLKIQHPEFQDNMHIKNHIKDSSRSEELLANDPRVKLYARRLKSRGLIRSAEKSAMLLFSGINPSVEKEFTTISTMIKEGRYLEDNDKGLILIGRKLAAKLSVGVGDKVVIMLQDIKGDFASAAFRVVGIFQTGFAEFDGGIAYLPLDQFQGLLGMEGYLTDIAVRLNDPEEVAALAADLKAKPALKELSVLTWKELLGPLVQMQEMMDLSIMISYIVLFLVIGVALTNTLLMSVFERIREFGVMMALGTSPRNVFWLIIAESFFLALLGLIWGGVLTFTSSYYFMVKGLDLSRWTAGLEFTGLNTLVYPVFRSFHLTMASTVVFITTLLVAVYPAAKASRLKPMEAIRFI